MDSGVDIFVETKSKKRGVVQCKRYKMGRHVEPADLRDLHGTRSLFTADFSVMVTTSVLSADAKAFVATVNQNAADQPHKPIIVLDQYGIASSFSAIPSVLNMLVRGPLKQQTTDWFQKATDLMQENKSKLGNVRPPWTKADVALLLRGYEEFKSSKSCYSKVMKKYGSQFSRRVTNRDLSNKMRYIQRQQRKQVAGTKNHF